MFVDNLPAPEQFAAWIPLILLIAAWSLSWKGYALWLAARNNHPWWFIALLVVNTIAILEIIYIFGFGLPEKRRKKSATDKPVMN